MGRDIDDWWPSNYHARTNTRLRSDERNPRWRLLVRVIFRTSIATTRSPTSRRAKNAARSRLHVPIETPTATVDPRRAELADFLRTRRAALTTELAELLATGGRRTPVLRREDVAELASISVALYTSLEQIRDVPVSAKTVDAIASALQLTQGERTHVQLLARGEETNLHEKISPALRRWVANARSTAIFVLDHTWNVVLRSTPAIAIFGGTNQPEGRENLLEAFPRDEDMRELFADWDAVCQSLAALFHLDFARYATDSDVHALVERLRTGNPHFTRAWEPHRKSAFPSAVREVRHQAGRRLRLEPTTYAVLESPGLRVTM